MQLERNVGSAVILYVLTELDELERNRDEVLRGGSE